MLYKDMSKIVNHILKYVGKLYVSGSFRRKEEVVNDLDFITKENLDTVLTRFQYYYDVVVIKKGKKYMKIVLHTSHHNVDIDIWKADDDYEYKYHKWMRKLDKGHSIYLRKLAKDKGLTLSDNGLVNEHNQLLDFRTFTDLKKFLLKPKEVVEGSGIIGRMGGKYKLKDVIISNFPPDYEKMIYVEPFVGGGSIIIKKEPSKEEIISDIDNKLISVYRGFQDYPFEKIKEDVNRHYTKKDFNKIKESKPVTPYNKFIKNFILYRISFYAQQRTYGNRVTISLKQDFGKRLKDVKIFNEDYKTIIKKYDSPNTLFYLDPPYEGSNKKHYENYEFDYEEFKDILSKIKGKFLLSINDSENIRDLFKDYKIKVVSTVYTDPVLGGQLRKIKELIIKNY